MEVLKVENVSKKFGKKVALDDVSLNVKGGEIFGLLGPNGAGKSTLIRIVTQIIMADSGNIEVKGEKLRREHIQSIGYLPEERGLYKKMKVGEQLIYLSRLKGMDKSTATTKVKEWVKKFEITDWWDKKIEDLSKGMQQKVQFISTVVHDPDILILDEPFSGFDPINANLIRDEILELRDKGCSIIFSTHRMESVEELCEHIVLINNAKKILDGQKDQIKSKYRSHTFEINYDGQIPDLPNGYEIVNQINGNQVLIKDQKQREPRELIQFLINNVQLHSFSEKIPSMNDIFISKVEEVNNG